MPHLIQAGVPVPHEVIDYLPIPSSLAAKWKEELKPKQDPAAQQAQQVMQEAAKADIDEKKTEAYFNEARARKTMAEAEAQEIENQAVRLGIVALEDL
jgi:membrane-bound lytic murein transglycosylase B